MFKKPIVLAGVGVIVGAVVALALFMFVLGGGKNSAAAAGPTPVPTVVAVAGKVGPHITLDDRIFNLVNTPALYLKMQTIIEFETKDARWAKALTTCKAARLIEDGPVYASANPLDAAPVVTAPATGEPAKAPACEAAATKLQDEFEASIGNGKQLMEDAVTTIVTAKTAQQVSTPAGKEQLKAEITKAVEHLFPEEHVSKVLFVNFITQ